VSDTRNHKDSELSHIYKEGGWPEPSRQIDAAILAAARAQHSFLRRWSPPLALAATVVLSFTLLLRMSGEKPNDALYSLPIPDKQPAAEEPKPAPAPAEGPVSVPNPAPAAESIPGRKSTPANPVSAPPSVPIAKSTPAPRSAPSAKPEVPPRPVSAPRPAVSAAPAPRPAAASSGPAPATAASEFALKKETPEAVRADRLVPPSEPPAEGGRALESASARDAPPEAKTPSPPSSPIEPFAQRPASAAARAAPGASTASDTATGIATRRSTPDRSPQAWIEDIRKLKVEGKTEEAGRELAELRKRYPEYPLPEDLR